MCRGSTRCSPRRRGSKPARSPCRRVPAGAQSRTRTRLRRIRGGTKIAERKPILRPSRGGEEMVIRARAAATLLVPAGLLVSAALLVRAALLTLAALLVAALAARPAAAQEDPSGSWSALYFEDMPERILGAEIGDYLGLPINDAARLRAESWSAALVELPENQCRQHGSDYGWRGPSNLRIWTEVDRATQKVIAYHTHLSAYGAEQTIWMDGRPHPPPYAAHTYAGFSTGEWEGDTLTVTTTHLKENWLGLNGVPRSDLATARVHIMRHGDYLTVAVITYDPVYLTEPLTRTIDFVYNPQMQMAPWPCEPVDEVDRPEGSVPHYLPGANRFLTEFAARYGVPPRAALGGAETMYPEYMRKLETMPRLPRLPSRVPADAPRGAIACSHEC